MPQRERDGILGQAKVLIAGDLAEGRGLDPLPPEARDLVASRPPRSRAGSAAPSAGEPPGPVGKATRTLSGHSPEIAPVR